MDTNILMFLFLISEKISENAQKNSQNLEAKNEELKKRLDSSEKEIGDLKTQIANLQKSALITNFLIKNLYDTLSKPEKGEENKPELNNNNNNYLSMFS